MRNTEAYMVYGDRQNKAVCTIYTRREKGMDIQVGDMVKLKKQHPCGSQEWEVLRIGADFRLKCAGCGHQIMIARKLVEKNIREIRKKP